MSTITTMRTTMTRGLLATSRPTRAALALGGALLLGAPSLASAEPHFAAGIAGGEAPRPFTMALRTAGPGPLLGDGPPAVLPLLLGGVDLTEEQRERVHAILREHHRGIAELFEEISTLNQQLADALTAPAPDEAALDALVEKIAAAREELIREGLKATLEVRKILTPAQIARAAELQARLEALDEERRKLLGDDVLFLAD
jgi:Spy/CpxP family protein refolding chaperone